VQLQSVKPDFLYYISGLLKKNDELIFSYYKIRSFYFIQKIKIKILKWLERPQDIHINFHKELLKCDRIIVQILMIHIKKKRACLFPMHVLILIRCNLVRIHFSNEFLQ